jgi:hypothetical protein
MFGLGVGGAAMFGVHAAFSAYRNSEWVGALGAIVMLATWAAWVAALRLLIARRRLVPVDLPASVVLADARCAHCGAWAPVHLASAMCCPFCSTTLVPTAPLLSASEQAALQHVATLRNEALRELLATEASRTPAFETVLTMLSGVQLVVIALAGLITLVVLATAAFRALF